MDSDAHRELARFRENLKGLRLEELGQVAADTLGEVIDLLRKLDAGTYAVEVAAAVAAELHRRNPAPVMRAPMIGTA